MDATVLANPGMFSEITQLGNREKIEARSIIDNSNGDI
jgi:hypothetical protein